MTPAARRRTTWESREGSSVGPDVPAASSGVALHGPDERAAPVRVTLLWPDKDLSANARVHWAKRAKAVKRARRDAAVVARATGLRKIEADAITATITFHPPDNRRRDLDGMLAACKSQLDGLADVIGVDDSRWSMSIRKAAPRPPHGAVIVEISVSA